MLVSHLIEPFKLENGKNSNKSCNLPMLGESAKLVPIRQQYDLSNSNCTRFWQVIVIEN